MGPREPREGGGLHLHRRQPGKLRRPDLQPGEGDAQAAHQFDIERAPAADPERGCLGLMSPDVARDRQGGQFAQGGLDVARLGAGAGLQQPFQPGIFVLR